MINEYGIDFYEDGSTKKEELDYLKELAEKSKGIIVEIGGFQGRTSIELGVGSKKGGNNKVYVIDPWRGHKLNGTKDVYFSKEVFLNNIKKSGVSDIVNAIQSLSEGALLKWDKQIGMLFIDGDHSYIGVKKDIKWINHVESGGIVAFHDYLLPKYKDSVVKAVNEIKDSLVFDRHINSLIVFRKK
jgi:predicted O-methyltransferase YrrM